MTRCGHLLVAVMVVGLPTLSGCAQAENEDHSSSSAAATSSIFDPCADIDDSQLRAVQINPATRARESPNPGELSACSFSNGEIDVRVSTSTTSFETYRDDNAGIREGLDIDDTPTLIVRRPDPDAPCELAMKSLEGIVLLTTSISTAAMEWGMDRCGPIVEVATAIEPAIGTR
ncbi:MULTISPECIES: DUF3558 family protein [Gordonia]|uniref:DUF3558 domain-containing protein n=1 Tax=Gordonia tangerina TaxID=2911060 RepID=A0ABS9DQS3_9ACTN|nr:DUF3558 family protein [Gordonia tangerina]MCF3940158.1 DUF3558 domain-containing protein [Gordonia tangerina]